MVQGGKQDPLEKSIKPIPLSKQPQDVYVWLQSLPFGFLQDLYKHYNTRRGVMEKVQEKDTHSQLHTSDFPPILLHKSIFCLIVELIGIELLFDLFYIFLRLLGLYFHAIIPQSVDLTTIYFGAFIGINILKFFFMVVFSLQWVTYTYHITPGEIRYVYGILSRKEKIYMSTYAQEVVYSQGIFGRLFNFGTIEIYNLTIKERVYLDSIPNPKKYTEIIKNSISEESEKYIPINL